MTERDLHILPFSGRLSAPKGRTWWCPDRDETLPLSAAGAENAKSAGQPFAMPEFVGAQFAALRGYWNSLRRGNAEIPFTDDLSLARLGKMAANIALLHVSENPQRFRFDLAGDHVAQVYGAELENRFADEVPPRAPLACFMAQCGITVESGSPTFYSHAKTDGWAEYHRLMLPFWGDGRVNAILAMFDFPGESDVV